MMVDVDWTKPIEAANLDGRVLPAVIEDPANFPHDPTWGVYIESEPPRYIHVDNDGKRMSGIDDDGWTIRNVTRPTHKTALECLDAMEALVRRMADDQRVVFPSLSSMDDYTEARRIVAEMAVVVETPEQVAERIIRTAGNGLINHQQRIASVADMIRDHAAHLRLHAKGQ